MKTSGAGDAHFSGQTSPFPPIAQYAFLSDCETGALVAPSIATSPNWSQAGYLVAFLVVLRTRRMLPSIAAGLAVLVLVTLIRL